MKRLIPIALSLAVAAGGALAVLPTQAAVTSGSRIKGASFPAVYYYGANGKRYVFPTEKTYKTWYPDFSGVQVISDSELAAIPIGGNVTYKPGVRMVKIQSIPNVYAVAKGGGLRWVKTEALATSYYGSNWNQMIDDIPDAFFINYTEGTPIDDTSDYNKNAEIAAATSINVDKGLVVAVPPKTVDVTITRAGYVPNSITVNVGDTVRWTNTDTINHSVTSDPHPLHTDLPALTANPISSGQQFSHTFTFAGTFGYHDHVNDPATHGTVIVVQP